MFALQQTAGRRHSLSTTKKCVACERTSYPPRLKLQLRLELQLACLGLGGRVWDSGRLRGGLLRFPPAPRGYVHFLVFSCFFLFFVGKSPVLHFLTKSTKKYKKVPKNMAGWAFEVLHSAHSTAGLLVKHREFLLQECWLIRAPPLQ